MWTTRSSYFFICFDEGCCLPFSHFSSSLSLRHRLRHTYTHPLTLVIFFYRLSYLFQVSHWIHWICREHLYLCARLCVCISLVVRMGFLYSHRINSSGLVCFGLSLISACVRIVYVYMRENVLLFMKFVKYFTLVFLRSGLSFFAFAQSALLAAPGETEDEFNIANVIWKCVIEFRNASNW